VPRGTHQRVAPHLMAAGPARRAKAKVLSWEPERVIVAHGMWARSGGREVIEQGLHWL
jgi:hypothetical protein